MKSSHNLRFGGGESMFRVPLGFNGRACLLRTNSRRVAELTTMFFPRRNQGEGGPVRAHLDLLVREARSAAAATGNFPVFRGRSEFVHADYGRYGSLWFELKAKVIFGVIAEELTADAFLFRNTVLAVVAGVLAPALGLVAVHAACVVKQGKAVLLAAPSGTGKSTLALTLTKRGWQLLSDEWTFVARADRGLRAWGMWTSVKLLPAAVRFFPELSQVEPTASLNGENAIEVDAWERFHLRRAIDAAPAAIVHLCRDRDGRVRARCGIAKSDAEEAYRALAREIEEQPREVTGGDGTRRDILRRLCQLPSFNLRFNCDPERVAVQFDQALEAPIHA